VPILQNCENEVDGVKCKGIVEINKALFKIGQCPLQKVEAKRKRTREIKFDLTVQRKMEQFKLYKAEHGHCNVPRPPNPKNNTLSYFVRSIRKAFSEREKGAESVWLTDELVAGLDSMGFEWKRQKTFKDHLMELKRFKEENGHCNVTVSHGDEPLRKWVREVCFHYKKHQKGEQAKIGDSKIAESDSMGFVWISRMTFNDHFMELKRFREENGHKHVPQGHELIVFVCRMHCKSYARGIQQAPIW